MATIPVIVHVFGVTPLEHALIRLKKKYTRETHGHVSDSSVAPATTRAPATAHGGLELQQNVWEPGGATKADWAWFPRPKASSPQIFRKPIWKDWQLRKKKVFPSQRRTLLLFLDVRFQVSKLRS